MRRCPFESKECGPQCGRWIPESAACADVVIAESFYRFSRCLSRCLDAEIKDLTVKSLLERANQ